jgi:tRNA G10  N-methylase Trm11
MKPITKTLAILGRQPALGLAELESLFGAKAITPIAGGAALLDIPASEVPFARLGSVIKICDVIATLETTDWAKIEAILVPACAGKAKELPEGKLTIGISVYGIDVTPSQLERTTLNIKKSIKATGRPVRIVPNKTREISSAQILHNKLTHASGWELVLYRDGAKTYLSRTDFVQDIESYAARDQLRPMRDARVGMLPPKLAQTIINLATGQVENIEYRSKNIEVATGAILDPFCGTGVVLQESVLMGYAAYGTDVEQRMIDYSGTNLNWLKAKYANQFAKHTGPLAILEQGDAATHKWTAPFDAVACEAYLGIPFAHMPSPDHLAESMQDCNTIIKGFLKNLSSQVPSGFRACVAMPAWHLPHSVKTLPCLAELTKLGWKRLPFKHAHPKDMVYRREDQVVGRELVVLTKI